jgi:putative ABC transport system ATP-binding protein
MGDHELHALRAVNEEIEDGEHVAIMGPSGSGKSTLLNVLGCLDSPTRGKYFLAGQDVAGLADDSLAEIRLRRIGFIFQSFHLVPRLSALQNIELPLIFAGKSPAERKEVATAALVSVGLLDRADHKPSELSGGQKQRVAIARATVMEPGLVLADEPTGNLDTRSGNVARRADRVLVMRDGEIVNRVSSADMSGLGGLFEDERAAI